MSGTLGRAPDPFDKQVMDFKDWLSQFNNYLNVTITNKINENTKNWHC